MYIPREVKKEKYYIIKSRESYSRPDNFISQEGNWKVQNHQNSVTEQLPTDFSGQFTEPTRPHRPWSRQQQVIFNIFRLNDDSKFDVIVKQYPRLEELLVENNNVKNITTIFGMGSHQIFDELSFTGNDVVKIENYRDQVIRKFKNLLYLDEQKTFLQL